MRSLRRFISWCRLPTLTVGLWLSFVCIPSGAPQSLGLDSVVAALRDEPIVIDPSKAYPTVETLPGSPFQPVSSATTSLIQQLAHSSNGVVQLPPGDYSIPIRIVCTGVHAAKTQHGIVYKIAPLQGKRAPIIIALLSRAPAAHISFMPLQQLVWQLEGGLSYDELPPQSKQLIDQLVPEDRNQLGADFVQTLQKVQKTGSILSSFPGLHGASAGSQELEAMIQSYESLRQALLNYANNFDALSQQLVNIVPGTADNAGPAAWSQLSSRAYARMIGGQYYGEVGTLQLRVLPGQGIALSSETKGRLIRTSYSPSASAAQTATTENDIAAVPLQGIGYPNESTMQGLAWMIANDPGLLLTLETVSNDLQGAKNVVMNLMWIDCAPNSAASAVAYVLGPTQLGPLAGPEASVYDLTDSVMTYLAASSPDAVADAAGGVETAGAGLLVSLAMDYEGPKLGISCDKYNIVSAIIKSAQSSNLPTAQTSHTIISGSVTPSAGALSMQAALRTDPSTPVANLKLRLLSCTSLSTCETNGGSSTSSNAQNPSTSAPNSAPTQRTITLAMLPVSVAAGASFTVSGTVHDAKGNPAGNTSIQIIVSAAGVSFPAVSLTTDSTGRFSTTFNAPSVSGTATITVTAAGSSPPATATATLTIGANGQQ
jgi:hypothetical protein